jgi:hypothetical protein
MHILQPNNLLITEDHSFIIINKKPRRHKSAFFVLPDLLKLNGARNGISSTTSQGFLVIYRRAFFLKSVEAGNVVETAGGVA